MLKKFSLFSHFSLVFVALLLFFSFAKSGTYLLLEKDGLPPKKNRFSDEELTFFFFPSRKTLRQFLFFLSKRKAESLT